MVAWDDKVKGRIEIANSELDDLVIFRSDGYATYNFAVVVDDIDMRITDVVRGDDHVNNTPRQINIYTALGVPVPAFAHLPMILDEQGAKLSKRTGAADVMQYRDAGYLPHALLNYLVRLGWSHGDQEVFSIAEMQSLFDLADVNAKAARLDMAKLGWLNQQYLKSDEPEAVATHLAWHLEQAGYDLSKGPKPAELVVALRERAQTLKEMAEKSAVWFGPLAQYDEAAVAKQFKPEARGPLEEARTRLASLDPWSPEAIGEALKATAEAQGIGLLRWLGAPGWLAVPASVALLDLAIYLQHRVFHAVPWLWRLHRVHHADLELDATTGLRFHPIEILLSMAIKIGVVVALGAPALAVLIFEVLLNAGSLFSHANIALPRRLEGWLRALIVTPEMHRVHHSVVRAETDSNFGFCLSWWDRLLGTYRAAPAAGLDGMTVGIGAFRDPAELRLDRLLTQPFRDDDAPPGVSPHRPVA